MSSLRRLPYDVPEEPEKADDIDFDSMTDEELDAYIERERRLARESYEMYRYCAENAEKAERQAAEACRRFDEINREYQRASRICEALDDPLYH